MQAAVARVATPVSDPGRDEMLIATGTIRDVLVHEDGAVTVEWVVLSAAVIGLGMIVLTPIAFTTHSTTHDVADYVEQTPVGYGNNN